MPSDLQVSNIKDLTGSNTGLSIASDGQVTINQNNPTLTLGSNATGFTGIKNADQWRLTVNYTSGSGDITSNLYRVDNSDFGSIGSAMTESSGVFTFPVTGKWLISLLGLFNSNSGTVAYGGLHLKTAVDAGSGDTYTLKLQTYASMYTTSHWQSHSACYLFDCTNVTTHKVKFSVETSTTNAYLMGHASINRTHFTFLRLGDT
tara:strand:- start:704 stop:1315 length:612 start_codon:yes stop_codon:yes gene_type:complete